MAEVIPFRGWRYDLERIADPAQVMAPPYDVITEADRKAFIAQHPHNIVRLDLGLDPLDGPPTQSRYELAASDLAQWRAEGVLIRDAVPTFYVYEQEYLPPAPQRSEGSGALRRRGIVALVRLAEYDKGQVLPHEGTLAAPKADRRKLMEATQCGLSQVFSIYSDPDNVLAAQTRELCATAPLFEVTDRDGVIHRMWLLTDPDRCAALTAMFAQRPVVIADGHHRYETALAYRDDMRARYGDDPAAPYQFVSMFLCNADEGQLTILPSHRLVKELPLEAEAKLWRSVMDVFETERVAIDSSSDDARSEGIHRLLAKMAQSPQGEHTLGLYAGGNYALLLHLRDMEHALEHGVDALPPVVRELDVALLHKLLIEGLMGLSGDMAATGVNVLFSRDGHDAANRVARGEAAMVLYVNTTRVEQVIAVATGGQRMPQKGTYFYPKVLAGIVFHDLRPDAAV
jgi:uncharacterized protein (DUF1015 family)